MKKIIGWLVLTFLGLGVGAVVLLVPSSVDTSEQLKNKTSSMSLFSLLQPSLQNAAVSTDGLSTDVTIDSEQLNQVLKSMLDQTENQDLLELAYSLNGDTLRIQYPLTIAGISSKLAVDFSPSSANNVLRFTITSAHLGNLPIPKALVSSILSSKIEQYSNIKMEENSILVTLPESQFRVNSISVKDSKATIKISMSLTGF